MKTFRTGLAILGLSAASIMVASPALADTEAPRESVTGQETATLAPKDKDGVGTQDISPAGCAGKTDYAHKSVDQASVHGRTKCNVAVGEVGVTTDLQQEGWLWWSTMETDDSVRNNSATSYDATPHWNCEDNVDNNYRGVSSHYSVESTGTYYGSTVGAEKTFIC